MKKHRLSKNLIALRALKKLSQENLCYELNDAGLKITRSAYSAYEEGRSEPKLNTLIAIADFYKITIDKLLLDL